MFIDKKLKNQISLPSNALVAHCWLAGHCVVFYHGKDTLLSKGPLSLQVCIWYGYQQIKMFGVKPCDGLASHPVEAELFLLQSIHTGLVCRLKLNLLKLFSWFTNPPKGSDAH